MALALRGSAHNESNSATLLNVTKPAGTVDGDILIAVTSNDANGRTHSADTGTWTPFAAGAAQSSFESVAWWREASSEPSSWDFSISGAADDFGVLVSVFHNDAGVGNWTLEDEQFSRTSSGNDLTTTSITGVADCLYFLSFCNDDNEDITSEPSGPTKLLEVGGPGAPDGQIASIALATYFELRGAGGVTDSISWGGSAEEIIAKAAIFTNDAAAGPSISSVTPDDYDDAETGIVIAGASFEASQGTGKVEISDNAVYATGTKVEQTETSWGDTSITITGVLGSLTPGALWMWVTNNSAERNAVGFVVTVHRAKAFAMSLSANIATSGENTTGQLTAPASGTFFGGRIQDDENPADAVDAGDDQYLEDEWCIEALPASVYDETYLFRVLVGTNPAGTITVTPGLTIETVPVGDITAAINLALSTAAALTGAGDIDAALALALTTAADLSAKGELAAAQQILMTVAADITGAGELAAALPTVLTVAADLKAAGEITASVNLALSVAAQLSAEGNIAAAMSLLTTVAANLTAAGNLTAANSILLSVTADLSGAGLLNAALSLAVTVAADLDAKGSLAAAHSILVSVTASLTEGDLKDVAASIPLTLAIIADLEATGSLTAAQALTLTVAANLSAQGKIEAAVALVLTVAADLKGAGELTAAAALQLSVAADLDAVGNLSAALTIAMSIAANLSAVGRLEAAMNLVVTVAASLSKASDIDLDALLPIVISVDADLEALGSLAAAPAMVMSVAADLAATGKLEAATSLLVTLAGDLRAAGVLRGALNINLTVAADLDALGQLVATPSIIVSVGANLTDAGAAPVSAAVFRDVWTGLGG